MLGSKTQFQKKTRKKKAQWTTYLKQIFSDTKADLEARRHNIAQMVEFIESNSAGNPVVVGGDTNLLYSREVDTVSILTDIGLIDPWVELVHNGTAPSADAEEPPECGNPAVTLECETLDKVL